MYEFYSPRRFFFITTSQKNLEQDKIKWRNRETDMESFDFFQFRCVYLETDVWSYFKT